MGIIFKSFQYLETRKVRHVEVKDHGIGAGVTSFQQTLLRSKRFHKAEVGLTQECFQKVARNLVIIDDENLAGGVTGNEIVQLTEQPASFHGLGLKTVRAQRKGFFAILHHGDHEYRDA